MLALTLCPQPQQGVTTAHSTAHCAGGEVRTEGSSVDCHNPSFYHQVQGIQVMIKGSKYFKKNYLLKNSILDNLVRFLGWLLPRGTNLLAHCL